MNAAHQAFGLTLKAHREQQGIPLSAIADTTKIGIALLSALERGDLGIYLANRTGRLGLLRMAVRTLLGTLEQARDFDALTAAAVEVDTRKRTLQVALDGEATRLRPPLRFRSRPGALRVLAPPRAE